MPEHLKTETKDCLLEVTTDYPLPNLLRLKYSVHNKSNQPLYLFNQLYSDILPGHVFVVDRQLVHVRHTEHKVIISKAIVPVPGGLEVEYRYVPCLSKVQPYETFEESFELALPVSPQSAYTPWLLHTAPVTGELFFETGYFIASPQAESMIREVVTPNGLVYRIDPFLLSSQQLLTAGPFIHPVAVFTTK